MQADSGWDHVLYSELSIARTLLIDARQQGNSEHAGYEQVADLGKPYEHGMLMHAPMHHPTA